MNTYTHKALPFYVFALSVLGLLLIPSFSNTAHAQCAVQICKSAPELPVVDFKVAELVFPFTVSQGGDSDTFELVPNSECFVSAFSGDNYEVVEEPLPGWVLDGVECSDSALVDVTFIKDGISLDCLGGTEITCTFTNVTGHVSNIPTLSEWGMIAAAGGLVLVGVFFAVRRRKAGVV